MCNVCYSGVNDAPKKETQFEVEVGGLESKERKKDEGKEIKRKRKQRERNQREL